MALITKLLTLFTTVGIVWISYSVYKKIQPPTAPAHFPENWWGHGESSAKEDTSIRKFEINVPNKVLEDLRHRLDIVPKFDKPLENTNFTYGFNTDTLTDIINFWKTKYDWREREKYLNKYPQFKTKIQGLDIHFLHIKPKVSSDVQVLPLLMLHGWPGSVREFWEIIPLLTTTQKYGFIFEVIVPSLPGYGFSEATSKPGLGPAHIAVIMKNLMKRIGHDQFYVQGGDWGAIIAANMATLFPKNVIGHHSNMCSVSSTYSNLKLIIGSFMPCLVVDKQHESKMYPLSSIFMNLLRESGYMHIQATKPNTVGIALRDSPVGLAAYILEKFSTWTDPSWIHLPDGGLTKKFTYTDLLDNIMIYWITDSITTSMRLYSENFSFENYKLQLEGVPTNVPTACARFPNELMYQSDEILKLKYYNLIQTTDMPRGGHFAAFEEPELLAEDIWSAVNKM